MFGKLRLKMTLINVAVTIILFAILIFSVHFLLQFNANRASDIFLQRIVDKVLSGKLKDLPPRTDRQNTDDVPGFILPPRPNFFFVKTTPSDDIFMYSSGTTVAEKELRGLIAKARTVQNPRHDFTYRGIAFACLRTPLPETGGYLFAFNDLSDELAAQRGLLMNLLYIGLFCILLSFIASFLMAKHAIKPIQRALLQQNNFVSDASHELRTPITIIQTNLDILRGAPPGDTLENNHKWLRNIQDETTRMTELINALLFLARADAKQQLLEREYFSLNETILDAVTPFAVLADAKTLTLATELSGTLTMLGDPARIKQALTILIDNALRHTSAQGKITVACRVEDDMLRLTVTDTGEGIAEEHLEKIFDRFYQADGSRSKGGAGLGLSMAKWIIEQHRGAISIASRLSEGTTVTIKLPMRKPSPDERTV